MCHFVLPIGKRSLLAFCVKTLLLTYSITHICFFAVQKTHMHSKINSASSVNLLVTFVTTDLRNVLLKHSDKKLSFLNSLRPTVCMSPSTAFGRRFAARDFHFVKTLCSTSSWHSRRFFAPQKFSLERRWSSRTFRYGYLVTTSPQSSTPPSTAASLRLAHRLRVLSTLMVWRAVCTRPGNVFTAPWLMRDY